MAVISACVGVVGVAVGCWSRCCGSTMCILVDHTQRAAREISEK